MSFSRNPMTPPSTHKFHKNSRSAKKSRHSAKTPKDLLIWGIHPVLEALQVCPHCVKEIVVEKNRIGHRLEEILALADKNGIQVSVGQAKLEVPFKKGAESTEQESSQGIYARIVYPFITLEVLLNKLKDTQGAPLLLALDSIQDPHNLGAIIRSAVAAGVSGLILPKDRSASITATVIKVSAGAVFHLDICRVTNLVNSFNELKEAGIWIFGAAKDAAIPVYDADLAVPACLVIGSEGKGLRPLVAENCDILISIPMHGSLDSLNASVAAGVLLFETLRQRKSQYT